MSARSPDSGQLGEYFRRYCDELLDPAEMARLESWLVADPNSLEQFLLYLEIHSELAWPTRTSSMPICDANQSPCAAKQRSSGSIAPSSLFSIDLSPPLTITADPTSGPDWPGLLTSIPFWGSLCLIAVVLSAVMLAWSPWSEAPQRIAKQPLPAGNVSGIEITSGTTRLELPGIGHVVLDGPAKFELIDSMRARLTEGRARVRVTEKSGHGFVVETPDGKVIDLGTEFGLEVGRHGSTSLVVFDGAVDLERPGASYVERLFRGEGVTYRASGPTGRIMSIVTGRTSTFERGGRFMLAGNKPVIVDVTDNIVDPSVRKFYEIVPCGLCEDALAYVDRTHEWNGVTMTGIATYLRHADYVRTFADDKTEKKLEITVTLDRPASLYVFFDRRLVPPGWLIKDFQNTGDVIGMDADRGGRNNSRTVKKGPAKSINAYFTVWKRIVTQPGPIVLGAPDAASKGTGAMYGIAAVALSPDESSQLGRDASSAPNQEVSKSKVREAEGKAK